MDQFLDVRTHIVWQGHRWLGHYISLVVGFKRHLFRDHLKENAADCPHVRGQVVPLPLNLLWRLVQLSPNNGRCASKGLFGFYLTTDAKVAYLRNIRIHVLGIPLEEYVIRSDISVHFAATMQNTQARDNMGCQFHVEVE